MVDVVDVALALAEAQDESDRVQVVLDVERHLLLGDVLAELAVDPEPADPAEAVAVGVEELLVEQLAGLLQLRRVAGAEPLVDPQQGALVVEGRVVLERLEDQGVLGVLEDLDRAERGVGEDLRRGLGDRGARLDQDLARGRVDDVAAGDPPLQLRGGLGAVGVDRLGLVERLEDGVVVREHRAHRPQERHRRELARLVDPDPQLVLAGDRQLDPAPALGDDPAGVELLVARLDVDDEVDAGAPVELADHDAASAPLMMNSPPPISVIGMSPR